MTALLVLLALAAEPENAWPRAGERVAGVRLLGVPDAAALRRYVELAPGDGYDAARVAHAVELFHATGRFENVLVEAERRPDGLLLAFRFVPAPLLVDVLVDGDPVIDADALRDAARLTRGEPLWWPRLERAARDVGLALARRGFLEARVEADRRLRQEGADAVFRVHAGQRAVVGPVSVAVRGGEASAARLVADLRARAAPAPGAPFAREVAQAAADSMRAALVRQRRFRAAVRVNETYDPRRGHVDLVFEADVGPPMTVVLEGVPEGLERRLRGGADRLLREGGLAPDVLDAAVERVEEALRGVGHRSPRVAAREEGARVVLAAEPGPRSRVASVRVAGAEGLSRPPVLATTPGAPVVDAVLEKDADALRQALEDEGYSEASVEVEAPEGIAEVPVAFRVRPGVRRTVRGIQVDAPAELPDSAGRQELRLRAGAPFRARDVAADRAALATAYRSAGWPAADVEPHVLPGEDGTTVDVILEVRTGPQLSVDHVVVSGLEHTREDVVRRELTLRESGPLALREVLESQRRLGALGLFSRVTVTEMDPESMPARTVVVAVQEAPRLGVAYGLGYGERDGPRGSVEATRRNLLGMDRSLTAFARLSFRGHRVLATFREPWVFGKRQELFLTAYREEGERETFRYLRFGGVVQTARPLGARTSLILRYLFQETDTFRVSYPCDEVERQFCNATVSGPSASVVVDTRDDPLDAKSGRFLSADLQFSHRVFGGTSFVKGFVQASTLHRLTSRALLGVAGRLGLARTLGFDTPLLLSLPERFFAGGDSSLRGFPPDLVRRGGGNALVLGSVELRVSLAPRLAVAGFVDAGNVFPFASDLTLRDLRYSAGFGLRYRSAVGPLRIDYAKKLDRGPGESPGRLHLTIGHAF